MEVDNVQGLHGLRVRVKNDYDPAFLLKVIERLTELEKRYASDAAKAGNGIGTGA